MPDTTETYSAADFRASRIPGQPRASEHEIQAAVMRWAATHEQEHPELEFLHAIPNGGDRHPVVAAKLKAEGVKAGVPDLFLPAARAGYFGLYVEMKRPGEGPSEAQRTWLKALRMLGYRAVVCEGYDEAVATIENYLSYDHTAG